VYDVGATKNSTVFYVFVWTFDWFSKRKCLEQHLLKKKSGPFTYRLYTPPCKNLAGVDKCKLNVL
jgi:hypothetical protein